MRDLNIDIRLLPALGLKLAPDHLSLRRGWIMAYPSLKFVGLF